MDNEAIAENEAEGKRQERKGQTVGKGHEASRQRRMAKGEPATGWPKWIERGPFSQGGSGPKSGETGASTQAEKAAEAEAEAEQAGG